ncbi:MAG TPA: GcrA family cell cycle regulator, partial [Tianweitania sediminis]|nr:GcrA family cell cycle regulator [Tianweitania sediminis]
MWTDERVELLKKLWTEGLSASQIAAQLGSVSRNAVIGKVHRLKLSSRGRATAAAPAAKKKTVAAAPVQKPVTTMRSVAQPQRIVTASVGATALQVQFDMEPVAQQVMR